MFYLHSECREFPAEQVGQLTPQVDRPGMTAMTTMITIQMVVEADAEILTPTDGLVAPVVLEVQEVPADRVALEGLADLEVLEEAAGLEGAEAAPGPNRSTMVSSSHRKICRR